MEKDKSIWMSGNMLVPIAKILITPKKVSFYEKFQRTFLKGISLLLMTYLIQILILRTLKIY